MVPVLNRVLPVVATGACPGGLPTGKPLRSGTGAAGVISWGLLIIGSFCFYSIIFF